MAQHLVMHYNAGWAGGYHYGIRYWEVWNEPNIQRDWVPNKGRYLFWFGTREQYFELYEKTAGALKALDPKLKVGGPGLAKGARLSPWREGFVQYCADRNVPLDFLSCQHRPERASGVRVLTIDRGAFPGTIVSWYPCKTL